MGEGSLRQGGARVGLGAGVVEGWAQRHSVTHIWKHQGPLRGEHLVDAEAKAGRPARGDRHRGGARGTGQPARGTAWRLPEAGGGEPKGWEAPALAVWGSGCPSGSQIRGARARLGHDVAVVRCSSTLT